MDVRLKPGVICIASRMGAGKSTLASSLAGSLGWSHASFGDYVRAVADQRGAGQSREALQQIGEELVSTNSGAFTRAVMSQVPWQQGCVIEGIRHLEVLRTIRQVVSPLPVFLVFIDISESVRKQRLRDRGMNEEEINRADQHSTEAQIGSVIKEQADLQLNGVMEVPHLVDEIRHFLVGARHDRS